MQDSISKSAALFRSSFALPFKENSFELYFKYK